MSVPSEAEIPLGGWSIGGNAVAVASMGLLAWAVVSELHTLGSTGQRATAVALLAAAVASWLLWMYLRSRREWAAGAALFAMALTGGALVGFAPVALVFPGVAVFSAANRWPIGWGALIGAAGWLAVAVSVLAVGRPDGILLGAVAAVLGGAVVGITRREAVERSEQLARMEVEVARTEVERARAELLSERNHFAARDPRRARPHPGGPLAPARSLQHGRRIRAGHQHRRPRATRAHPSVGPRGARRSAGAVRALRDEPAPLGEQLTRLSAQHGATFTESGPPVRLPAPAVLGLYRVAQEALTNVMKHAPGAPTSVALTWSPDAVSLRIDNDASTHTAPTVLARSGGGFGLRGIAERLELLGGEVDSGPTASGWRVTAAVPLGGAPAAAARREAAS